MILNSVTFALAAGSDTERVYLYNFGGVVFLNCSGDIITSFLDSIPQYTESLKADTVALSRRIPAGDRSKT
jgi:hypothetical protein